MKCVILYQDHKPSRSSHVRLPTTAQSCGAHSFNARIG